MPIVLKVYRCLGHGLKVCMLFGYNPQIIFCHFFTTWTSNFSSQSEKVLDIMCKQLLLQFMLIILKLYMWLSRGLKMCIWFGYNPKIIFSYCFHEFSLVVF